MALQLAKQISIDKFNNSINIWYETFTEDNNNYEYYLSDEGEYIQQIIDAGYYNDSINTKINTKASFFGVTRNVNTLYIPKEINLSFDIKLSRLVQLITCVSNMMATGDAS